MEVWMAAPALRGCPARGVACDLAICQSL